MLRKLRALEHSEENGFSLIELLVVILVIGILAAIALPAFLGQRQKGQDADAKSNARNLVSNLESFYATEKTYDKAKALASEDITKSSLPIGGGDGEVTITAGDDNSYTIVAKSKSGGSFTIAKAGDGSIARSCSNKGDGGCGSDGKW
jgi:type IV pilus assembly protein PilA